MNPKRINQIKEIVRKTLSQSENDNNFSVKIALRTDMNIYEKVFAGCMTRQELCANCEFESEERTFVTEEIKNGFIVSEVITKRTFCKNLSDVFTFINSVVK